MPDSKKKFKNEKDVVMQHDSDTQGSVPAKNDGKYYTPRAVIRYMLELLKPENNFKVNHSIDVSDYFPSEIKKGKSLDQYPEYMKVFNKRINSQRKK